MRTKTVHPTLAAIAAGLSCAGLPGVVAPAAAQGQSRLGGLGDEPRPQPGPRPDERVTRVIYGADDRREVSTLADPTLRAIADATCLIVTPGELSPGAPAPGEPGGVFELATEPFLGVFGEAVCFDEPFWGQPLAGFCTGVLIAPHLVLTAGHCVGPSFLSQAPAALSAFVFGFELAPDGTWGGVVDEALVAFGAAQVVSEIGLGGADYAVVRLDQPITGIAPAEVRREGEIAVGADVAIVGHPIGLPKKFADGATVQTSVAGQPTFMADLDAYIVNSGSAVIDPHSGLVEGVMNRGNQDFVFDEVDFCVRSQVDPPTPFFEEVTRSTEFADFVPAADGLVAPIDASPGPGNAAPIQLPLNAAAAEPLEPGQGTFIIESLPETGRLWVQDGLGVWSTIDAVPAGVGQGAVFYRAAPGAAGVDLFRYRVAGGGRSSAQDSALIRLESAGELGSDLDASGAEDFFDVVVFLAAFDEGAPLADLLTDGVINAGDVFALLNGFGGDDDD